MSDQIEKERNAAGEPGTGGEPAPGGTVALELAGGHRLHLARQGEGSDRLRLETPGGAVALSIEVRDGGVTLALEGVDLTLRSSGRLALEAERLALVGRSGLDLVSSRGDVRLRANDDVRLNGERVMVNC
jgi:hypothetical protein